MLVGTVHISQLDPMHGRGRGGGRGLSGQSHDPAPIVVPGLHTRRYFLRYLDPSNAEALVDKVRPAHELVGLVSVCGLTTV